MKSKQIKTIHKALISLLKRSGLMYDENTLTVETLNSSQWDKILNLSVAYNQREFIETSSQCLNDAQRNAYGMKWNFYGIFIKDVLIGFAMHGKQYFRLIPYSQVWLDRFMIDEEFQGKGFGKQALKIICDKIFQEYNCKKLFLSVHKENTQAIMLYEKLGFKKTLFKDSNGELIMKLMVN